MNEAIIARILAAYGVSHQSISPPQKGYRNSAYPVLMSNGRWLNLMLYKTEPEITARIQRANQVANFLAAKGLPTRQSADRRILKLQSGSAIKYAALYHYLPGQTIPWEAYTKDHLKLLGMGLGMMHCRLRTLPLRAPSVVDEYEALLGRMQRYFASPSVRAALSEKAKLQLNQRVFAKNTALLTACKRLPDQHMLHMDFVRSNLLFEPAKPADKFVENSLALSGILDFEKTAYGHPLFDIARTLAFLLVDCKYKTPAEVRKYFLRSGYVKRGGAAFRNIIITRGARQLDVLEELVSLFLLHDFYKFLRHNPYESLPQNEHFIRTRDMLLERRMVQYG